MPAVETHVVLWHTSDSRMNASVEKRMMTIIASDQNLPNPEKSGSSIVV